MVATCVATCMLQAVNNQANMSAMGFSARGKSEKLSRLTGRSPQVLDQSQGWLDSKTYFEEPYMIWPITNSAHKQTLQQTNKAANIERLTNRKLKQKANIVANMQATSSKHRNARQSAASMWQTAELWPMRHRNRQQTYAQGTPDRKNRSTQP